MQELFFNNYFYFNKNMDYPLAIAVYSICCSERCFQFILSVLFVLFSQHFHEQVLEKADIIQATGDAIVTLPDVACLTPR